MEEAVKERPMPTGEGLTFEKVWAMFQETDRKFQEDRKQQQEWQDKQRQEWQEKWQKEAEERRKEAEERQKEAEERRKEAEERRKEAEEQRKEAEEQRKEAEERQKKLDRQFDEMAKQRKLYDKKIGDLHNSFGKLAEHLVLPGITKRFNELGFHFQEIFQGSHKLVDSEGEVLAEIDILLENGETVIAVEVKTKPDEEDIERHIERVEILRDFRLHKKNERKKVMGAMAGAIFPKHVKDAAYKAGLYVIVQSGDTMKIEMPSGWKPREW
jgi:hypothetical protein